MHEKMSADTRRRSCVNYPNVFCARTKLIENRKSITVLLLKCEHHRLCVKYVQKTYGTRIQEGAKVLNLVCLWFGENIQTSLTTTIFAYHTNRRN